MRECFREFGGPCQFTATFGPSMREQFYRVVVGVGVREFKSPVTCRKTLFFPTMRRVDCLVLHVV